MELKEMIKVMTHYLNGGEVEYSVKEDDYSSWTKCVNPLWDWFDYNYRIREPKQKVTIEKWLCKDISNGEYFIYDSSMVHLYLKETTSIEKVKLIETYEVEL